MSNDLNKLIVIKLIHQISAFPKKPPAEPLWGPVAPGGRGVSEAELGKIRLDVLGFQILPFVPIHEMLSVFLVPIMSHRDRGMMLYRDKEMMSHEEFHLMPWKITSQGKGYEVTQGQGDDVTQGNALDGMGTGR